MNEIAITPKFKLTGIDLSIRESVYQPMMVVQTKEDKNRLIAMACALSGCPLPDDLNRMIIYSQLDLYFDKITVNDFRLAFEFNLLQEKPIQHFQNCSWAWICEVLKHFKKYQSKLIVLNPEPKHELSLIEIEAKNKEAEIYFLDQIETDFQEWILDQNYQVVFAALKYEILQKTGKCNLTGDEKKKIHLEAENSLMKKQLETSESSYQRNTAKNLIERYVNNEMTANDKMRVKQHARELALYTNFKKRLTLQK